MSVDVFVNATAAIVAVGGTTAPAAGTVENWTVNAPATWPVLTTGQQFRVIDVLDGGRTAGYEIMLVTASATGISAAWTVTRGVEGTTPYAHATNWTCVPAVTAGSLTTSGGGSGNATEIQGVAVAATAPTTDQVIAYNGTEYAPTTVTPSGNATEIQGVAVSSTVPTNGQVLEYNSTSTEWAPATPPSGALATEGGVLASNTAVAAATLTTVLTTASLAVGTWLVSWTAVFGGSAEAEAKLVVGTAAATFLGTQSAVISSNGGFETGGGSVLVTVTTAGTLEIQAESSASGTVYATSPTYTFPGATAYTAVNLG